MANWFPSTERSYEIPINEEHKSTRKEQPRFEGWPRDFNRIEASFSQDGSPCRCIGNEAIGCLSASVYPTLSCVEFRFSVGGFARSISFSVDPDYHRYRFIYFYQHSRSIFAFLTSIVSYSYEHKKRAHIVCLSLSFSFHGITRGFSLNLHKRTEWNGFPQVCFSGKIFPSIEEETFSTGFPPFIFFFLESRGTQAERTFVRGTKVSFERNRKRTTFRGG